MVRMLIECFLDQFDLKKMMPKSNSGSAKSTNFQRRNFLRASGVAVALPLFESRTAHATTISSPRRETEPARLVCVGNPYGMIPDDFFPAQAGRNYDAPMLLKPLERHRDGFTVFSNFDHGYSGGHRVVDTFLTGIKTIDAKAAVDGNISIDQRAAEFVGAQTRFPTLNVGAGGGCEMCWTRSGVNVPVLTRSRDVFRLLFVDDPLAAKKQLGVKNKRRGSILDSINQQAHSLNRELSKLDQRKLDEYLTAIRDVESKLKMSQHWIGKPKPKIQMQEPEDEGFVESLGVFYELISLALQTDSTRVATLEIPEGFNTSALGLKNSYHGYSHHGKAEKNLQGLRVIETFQATEFSKFLDRLKNIKLANGQAMFDKTTVLFGSGMGNGSSHSNKNLPILVAGGGLKHVGHVVLPEEKNKRVPLSNLYVKLLQQFGIETDRFGSSSGRLSDFDQFEKGAIS